MEVPKDFDVVFISEPRIFDIGGTLGTINHPAFLRITPIHQRSKVIAYINRRHAKFRHNVNQGRNVVKVTLGITSITGVYMDGKHPANYLVDDLTSICTLNRACILGDFNSHHPAWGGSTTERGSLVEEWAETNRLTQHTPYNATTFRRTHADGSITASLLDLTFTNPNAVWTAHELNLSWLESDHCLLAGSIRGQIPYTRIYTTTDWSRWE